MECEKIFNDMQFLQIGMSNENGYALSIDGQLLRWDMLTNNSTDQSAETISENVVSFSASPQFDILAFIDGNNDVFYINKSYYIGKSKIEKISLDEDIAQVYVGDVSVYAISNSGNIYTWGGSIDNPFFSTDLKPVKVNFTFKLNSDN